MTEQLELFPSFEPKSLPPAPPSATPLPQPPTLAAVHSQAATIVEALADLDIRVPLLPKPGKQKPVRCPKCVPVGTESKRTDLVVRIATGEALFRCARCGWSNRITVGRQP